jgi:thiopeptide-type bacteriocin biosynthesis protein
VSAVAPSYSPASFFVIRSPLLPLVTALDLGQGLSGPLFENQESEATRALINRLLSTLTNPIVREALALASPDLHKQLHKWQPGDGTKKERRLTVSLAKYLLRMASRPTPFGLFASCSMGTLGTVTNLQLESVDSIVRSSRVDFECLVAIGRHLVDGPRRDCLWYTTNASSLRIGDRIRWSQRVSRDGTTVYVLNEVLVTRALGVVLRLACAGSSGSDLIAALARECGVAKEAALDYLRRLTAVQLLENQGEPPLTAADPLAEVIKAARAAGLVKLADLLELVDEDLRGIDTRGVGQPTDVYENPFTVLSNVCPEVPANHLIQVDVWRPSVAAISAKNLTCFGDAIECLRRCAPFGPDPEAALREFVDRFRDRYGEQDVALLEALDPDVGVGLTQDGRPDPAISPLAAAVPLNRALPPSDQWGDRELWAFRRLQETLSDKTPELRIDDCDLSPLPEPTWELPDSFAVLGSIARTGQHEEPHLFLDKVFGPSGARLLARFVHLDSTFRELVRDYLDREAALHPEAVYAEIVHLPRGRFGNFLLRPRLRDFEIPYLGQSAAPSFQQLHPSDLYLRLDGSRLVLWSARLRREIIPRLSSAHHFATHRELPLYRFLCTLQHQGAMPWLSWSWGPLKNAAPYLPRVVYRAVVLARARWRLDSEDTRRLRESSWQEASEWLDRWRSRFAVPQYVVLPDADNELLLDLDSSLGVGLLRQAIRSGHPVTLLEQWPTPDRLLAHDKTNTYVSQLVLPFIRTTSACSQPTRTLSPTRQYGIRRRLGPGTELVYLKLYSGRTGQDRLIAGPIADLVADARTRALLAGWYFVRYSDPEPHVRLRLMATRSQGPALAALATEWFAPGRPAAGSLQSVVQATHEREIERYGGPAGLLVAERLANIDSDAIVQHLWSGRESTPKDRWLLAPWLAKTLLESSGFSLEQIEGIAQNRTDGLCREFRLGVNARRAVAREYRKRQGELLASLAALDADPGPAWRTWRTAVENLCSRLARLDRARKLRRPLPEIAISICHMTLNRLLPADQRLNELVIFAFLVRASKTLLRLSRSPMALSQS